MKNPQQDSPKNSQLNTLLKTGWILLLVSFLEGAALMAVELIGAKLVSPYYGNSIYVWSSVLGTTLGGLALGYYIGGQWTNKPGLVKKLRISLVVGAVVTAILPWTSTGILEITIGMDSLVAGVALSSLVILTPPLLLFGTISPMVIHLLAGKNQEAGTATGLVYAVSTAGGILATFIFAFQLMPYYGLRMSCWVSAAMLLAAFAVSMSKKIHSFEPLN